MGWHAHQRRAGRARDAGHSRPRLPQASAPRARGARRDATAQVIATTGAKPPEALGLATLPPNVRVERFIPYEVLLPHVDVMVTNGGYGGTTQALAHGVPLVLAGTTEDKMEVNRRVAWSGVGIDLRTDWPKPAAIREAVGRVLAEPSFRRRAEAIRDEMRQYDAPRLAAATIEGLIAGSDALPS